MARDKFHHAVRRALEKEDWTITDDPLDFKVGVKLVLERKAIKLIVYQPTKEIIVAWII